MIYFRRPTDPTTLERRWSEEFVPLAEKMPGIRRVTVSRVVGAPGEGCDLHLVHEFFFRDKEALTRAMLSPEGQAAGRALMSFAGEHATLCFAEHLEEDRPPAVEEGAGESGP
jgi:uncharacterized protein (TIGR02118 family)